MQWLLLLIDKGQIPDNTGGKSRGRCQFIEEIGSGLHPWQERLFSREREEKKGLVSYKPSPILITVQLNTDTILRAGCPKF